MNNHYKQAKEIDANNRKLYELLFVESNPIPIKWALSELKMIQKCFKLVRIYGATLLIGGCMSMEV